MGNNSDFELEFGILNNKRITEHNVIAKEVIDNTMPPSIHSASFKGEGKVTDV